MTTTSQICKFYDGTVVLHALHVRFSLLFISRLLSFFPRLEMTRFEVVGFQIALLNSGAVRLDTIFAVVFCRERDIQQTCEERTADIEERLGEVMRKGQRELQETRTKLKKELAKVRFPLRVEKIWNTRRRKLLLRNFRDGDFKAQSYKSVIWLVLWGKRIVLHGLRAFKWISLT